MRLARGLKSFLCCLVILSVVMMVTDYAWAGSKILNILGGSLLGDIMGGNKASKGSKTANILGGSLVGNMMGGNKASKGSKTANILVGTLPGNMMGGNTASIFGGTLVGNLLGGNTAGTANTRVRAVPLTGFMKPKQDASKSINQGGTITDLLGRPTTTPTIQSLLRKKGDSNSGRQKVYSINK